MAARWATDDIFTNEVGRNHGNSPLYLLTPSGRPTHCVPAANGRKRDGRRWNSPEMDGRRAKRGPITLAHAAECRLLRAVDQRPAGDSALHFPPFYLTTVVRRATHHRLTKPTYTSEGSPREGAGEERGRG